VCVRACVCVFERVFRWIGASRKWKCYLCGIASVSHRTRNNVCVYVCECGSLCNVCARVCMWVCVCVQKGAPYTWKSTTETSGYFSKHMRMCACTTKTSACSSELVGRWFGWMLWLALHARCVSYRSCLIHHAIFGPVVCVCVCMCVRVCVLHA